MKFFLIFSILFLSVFSSEFFGQIFVNEDVNFEKKGTNTFNGIIYIGENILENGEIFLFQNTRYQYKFAQSIKLDKGNFNFQKLENGSYTIYVIPEMDYDFLFFPKYLPTYSGDTYKWDKSHEKIITENTIDFKFYLNSFQDAFYGNQKIYGKIKYQTKFTGNKDIPVVIMLLNEKKVPMDFRKADPNTGEFCFDYLPEGKYFIHPEIPGIYSEDFEVIVNAETENIDINFKISNDLIVAIKNEEGINNRFNGKNLKIYLEDFETADVVCELVNISGQSVSKDIYYTENININTSNLAAGIYILKVSSYDYRKVKTQKVYINNYD